MSVTNLNVKKAEAIVDALYSAGCGNIVFEALQHVPSDNLKDMHDMIIHILEHRAIEEQ